MYKELDIIVLNENLPEYKIYKGDVGTIVAVYQNGKAYEVEFVSFDGEIIALITLTNNQIRPVKNKDLITVREFI